MTPTQELIASMVLEPMTANDIAELIGKTPGATEVALRAMYDKGLMYRKRDPEKPIRFLYWARPSNAKVEKELRKEVGELPVQELITKLEEELKETRPEEMPMTELKPGSLTIDGDIWEVRMTVPLQETLRALRKASDLAPQEDAILLRRLAAIMELTHA